MATPVVTASAALLLYKDNNLTPREIKNLLYSSGSSSFSKQYGFGKLDIGKAMSKRISEMAVENEQKLENVRKTMETKIAALQVDNNIQLEKMRETVDEKLQKTLNDRISKSFEMVNKSLQEVTDGIGAMKTIARDVNGLSNVLSNVKTRGIVGEIQLGAILREILSPDQYDENVNTVGHGQNRVEFAVRLPGEGTDVVYLPIDSKFPGETYQQYRNALDSGDKAAADAAGRKLDTVIRAGAKDIHEERGAGRRTGRNAGEDRKRCRQKNSGSHL